MAAVSPACSALELILLYRGEVDEHGDELTQGVPNERILVELCRVATPESALALIGLVFPGWRIDQIPYTEQTLVRGAFDTWKRQEAMSR